MPGILGVLDPTTGLYSSNSGPFASLTAKEIMEGWDDPIIQQLAPGTVRCLAIVDTHMWLVTQSRGAVLAM